MRRGTDNAARGAHPGVRQLGPRVRGIFIGFVHGKTCLHLSWHEPTAVITITWTDSYDGVKDIIFFRGDLTEIAPRCDAVFVEAGPCSIDGSTLYRGKGTATGDKAGWKACNPGIDLLPSGTGAAAFTGVVKDGKITIGAYADLGTPMEGALTGAFVVPVGGGTATFAPTPVVGTVCPHFSYGTIEVIGLKLPTP